jgi:hypothetical protein
VAVKKKLSETVLAAKVLKMVSAGSVEKILVGSMRVE